MISLKGIIEKRRDLISMLKRISNETYNRILCST